MGSVSLFYEDIEVPQHFVGNGRTVTDADFLTVCMTTGDWHPIHCNERYAEGTDFKRPIIGGVFGVMLFAGALHYFRVFEDSTLGMLALEDWQFKHPIYSGDTVRVEMTVISKRLTKKPGRGIIDREIKIINQDDVIVQQGRSPMLIRLRETSAT